MGASNIATILIAHRLLIASVIAINKTNIISNGHEQYGVSVQALA